MLRGFGIYSNKHGVHHCAEGEGEAERDSVTCPRPPAQEVASGSLYVQHGFFCSSQARMDQGGQGKGDVWGVRGDPSCIVQGDLGWEWMCQRPVGGTFSGRDICTWPCTPVTQDLMTTILTPPRRRKLSCHQQGPAFPSFLPTPASPQGLVFSGAFSVWLGSHGTHGPSGT